MSLNPGRELTLIVPGLFGPSVPQGVSKSAALQSLVEGLELDALCDLLTAARRSAAPSEETLEGLVFTAFGYGKHSDDDWPVAAVTRIEDQGGENAHWYLRADPVHLKADMSDLVLFDGSHFELSLNEARQLAEALMGYFDDAGWTLEVRHPLRWYLRTDAPQRITTTPVSTASANPVNVHLPRGPDAGHWRKVLNETQMLLHQSRVNEAREQRGEPAINSLWFWGCGVLPEKVDPGFDAVYSDDPLACGLAQRAGLTVRPVPANADSLLRGDSESSRTLVIMEQGYAAARSGDVERWREFICDINRDWIVPLCAARRDRRLESLRLLNDRGGRYVIGPYRWWQRFRRPRAFANLASQ